MDPSIDPASSTPMTSASLMSNYAPFPTYASTSAQLTPYSQGAVAPVSPYAYATNGAPSTPTSQPLPHTPTQSLGQVPVSQRFPPFPPNSTHGTTGAWHWPHSPATGGPAAFSLGHTGGAMPSTFPHQWPSFPGPATGLGADLYSHRQTFHKARVSTTLWEDENTLCYQVDAKGYSVARRRDNSFVNGTKLLNVVGMSRGKRDGILKNEKGRRVVKVGAMHLKGVWIPFPRAKALATQYNIIDQLYPLFDDDPSTYLNGPAMYPGFSGVNPHDPAATATVAGLSGSTLGFPSYRVPYGADATPTTASSSSYLGTLAAQSGSTTTTHSSLVNSPNGVSDLTHNLNSMMTSGHSNHAAAAVAAAAAAMGATTHSPLTGNGSSVPSPGTPTAGSLSGYHQTTGIYHVSTSGAATPTKSAGTDGIFTNHRNAQLFSDATHRPAPTGTYDRTHNRYAPYGYTGGSSYGRRGSDVQTSAASMLTAAASSSAAESSPLYKYKSNSGEMASTTHDYSGSLLAPHSTASAVSHLSQLASAAENSDLTLSLSGSSVGLVTTTTAPGYSPTQPLNDGDAPMTSNPGANTVTATAHSGLQDGFNSYGTPSTVTSQYHAEGGTDPTGFGYGNPIDSSQQQQQAVQNPYRHQYPQAYPSHHPYNQSAASGMMPHFAAAAYANHNPFGALPASTSSTTSSSTAYSAGTDGVGGAGGSMTTDTHLHAQHQHHRHQYHSTVGQGCPGNGSGSHSYGITSDTNAYTTDASALSGDPPAYTLPRIDPNIKQEHEDEEDASHSSGSNGTSHTITV
ncbi:hypothetical protein IWQ60_011318 [Tieghemiomyces parasiticus]|uniref:HTH APSES-type domain-containing protein n=1 Tax=Tieghemiomyces parasiticus TaxID=78921 RepID=A0A9W7ZNH8_9FUNG|nr:hypothetical protein IWQ60_011318 [Tieghemiomyces parasiticus]